MALSLTCRPPVPQNNYREYKQGENSRRKREEPKPTHHSHCVKQLAEVVSKHETGMNAAFIQFAAGCCCDRRGNDNRNQRQEDPKQDNSIADAFGACCHVLLPERSVSEFALFIFATQGLGGVLQAKQWKQEGFRIRPTL